MKFKFIIVTMDGDIFGTNDEDLALQYLQAEETVIDVSTGNSLDYLDDELLQSDAVEEAQLIESEDEDEDLDD